MHHRLLCPKLLRYHGQPRCAPELQPLTYAPYLSAFLLSCCQPLIKSYSPVRTTPASCSPHPAHTFPFPAHTRPYPPARAHTHPQPFTPPPPRPATCSSHRLSSPTSSRRTTRVSPFPEQVLCCVSTPASRIRLCSLLPRGQVQSTAGS